MTSLSHLIEAPLARALGWTLLHSLWEGAVAALVLLAALSMTRSPRVRYVCACLALLGVLAGFTITLCKIMPQQYGVAVAFPHKLPGSAPDDRQSSPGVPAPFPMAAVLPWLTP